MSIFYIFNPAQYLNLKTILLTINKQQIRSLLRQNCFFFLTVVNGLLIARIRP